MAFNVSYIKMWMQVDNIVFKMKSLTGKTQAESIQYHSYTHNTHTFLYQEIKFVLDSILGSQDNTQRVCVT